MKQDKSKLPILQHTDHSLSAVAWEERRRIRVAVSRSREHRAQVALDRLLGLGRDDDDEEEL
jgi:hypothetical protein